MSQNDAPSQLRDDFIDAVLQSAYEVDSEPEEQSIQKVLRRIDSQEHASQVHEPTHKLGRAQRRRRWLTWAVAASALLAIAIGPQFLGTSGTAMAAVERSLAAAQEMVARHYRITVTTQKETTYGRVIESDLFVQGLDQFALRHPALFRNNDIWLGSDGDESWLVPAFGPVRVGDEKAVIRWLASLSLREQSEPQDTQVSTPYLHIESALVRMQRGYQLRQESDEILALDDGELRTCQHIVGELMSQEFPAAPDRVDLWCDKQSGVTIRLHAIWDEPDGRLGREKIAISFVDSNELPDNWFKAEGHYRGFRRKLVFDSNTE